MTVVIDCIHHNKYQEAYVFKRGNELARVDIGYKATSKVSHVTAPQLTELGAELVTLLAPLKGALLASGPANAALEARFGKPFLNDFHQRANALCTEAGIAIRNVVEHQWSLRLTFTRAEEIAVYDVYYNGQGQFTTCAPLATACSPSTLVGDVGVLLTEGMRA